jgi:hypothetical protein
MKRLVFGLVAVSSLLFGCNGLLDAPQPQDNEGLTVEFTSADGSLYTVNQFGATVSAAEIDDFISRNRADLVAVAGDLTGIVISGIDLLAAQESTRSGIVEGWHSHKNDPSRTNFWNVRTPCGLWFHWGHTLKHMVKSCYCGSVMESFDYCVSS